MIPPVDIEATRSLHREIISYQRNDPWLTHMLWTCIIVFVGMVGCFAP